MARRREFGRRIFPDRAIRVGVGRRPTFAATVAHRSPRYGRISYAAAPLIHGFITYVVTANVPPKVAQALARHSTIARKMNWLAHLCMNDLVGAVERLRASAKK